MIVDSSDNNDRAIEFNVACILIGPISFSFPFAVYHYCVLFISKYVDQLEESELSKENFRGWLERFPQREVHASMHEVTIAVILLPFDSHFWYFAWVQLSERALATIFATCLYSNLNAQLFAAMGIEVLAGVFEYWKMPFLDPEEDKYNVIWRSIAFLILLITLLLKFIGEKFAMVGDISLLLLTFAAIGLFIKAMDPPRIYQIYRLNAAVKKFRETKVDDNECLDTSAGPNNLGKLGTFAKIPNELGLTRLLQTTFEQLPIDISRSTVVKDAFNFTQQYRLLLHAENDAKLGEYIISNNLFRDVGPLLSLVGSRIVQPVPNLISAYTNVTRIIMSDMNLDDDCSIKALASLDNLVYLNLDDNLFETMIDGLGTLVKVKKLSIKNLRKWRGEIVKKVSVNAAVNKFDQVTDQVEDQVADQIDCMTSLANDLQAMTNLKELNMEGSQFTSGSVSIEFVSYLQKLGRCTAINGKFLDAVITSYLDLGGTNFNLFQIGFSYNQFRLGGANNDQLRQGKEWVNHRPFISVNHGLSLGYPLDKVYHTLGPVKSFACGAGKSWKSACFNLDGSLLIGLARSHDKETRESGDQVYVYNVNSGRCIMQFQASQDITSPMQFQASKDITSPICITKDGHHVVVVSYLNGGKFGMRMWNLASGACVSTFIGHDGTVNSIFVSPDGRTLVSASDDKTVKLWNIKTCACVHTLTGHSKLVRSVYVSPNGRHVVSGSQDRTVKVWDMESGACLSTFSGHEIEVLSVCVSKDGRYVVSGSADWKVMVWDIQSCILGETGSSFAKPVSMFKRHLAPVCSVCISPDGRTLFSTDERRITMVLDLHALIKVPTTSRTIFNIRDDATVLKKIEWDKENVGDVTSVCISTSGDQIASISNSYLSLLN
jgi:WD40 repeat protein